MDPGGPHTGTSHAKAVDFGRSILSGPGADLRVYGRACGATATVAAGLVLAGWIFDVPSLQAVLPGSVGMSPRVALAFVLAGISLLLLCLDRQSATRQRVAQAFALLVVLLGITALGEHVLAALAGGERRQGPAFDRHSPSR